MYPYKHEVIQPTANEKQELPLSLSRKRLVSSTPYNEGWKFRKRLLEEETKSLNQLQISSSLS